MIALDIKYIIHFDYGSDFMLIKNELLCLSCFGVRHFQELFMDILFIYPYNAVENSNILVFLKFKTLKVFH